MNCVYDVPNCMHIGPTAQSCSSDNDLLNFQTNMTETDVIWKGEFNFDRRSITIHTE